MTKDLLVEREIPKFLEDPDTTPMSVRPPTKEDKILPKEEVEEKNLLLLLLGESSLLL